jgi:hypothetical protein
MSYTQITAKVNDQTIQLINVPVLASGSVDVLQVNCEFDSLWDGYGKTAVFYKKPTEVYHVPMALGVATVPHEVLDAEGGFFFGVFGVADNTRTTETVRFDVKQGAITLSNAETEEPTPNIYEQLLASFGKVEQDLAVERARLNELVALRGDGVLNEPLSAEYVTGTIKSNGCSAYIDISITQLSLVAGGYHYTDYCLNPNQAPLGPVQLETSNPDINITIEAPAADGWSRILIENPSSADYGAEQVTTATAFYPLANPSNTELADLRVGADGTTYDTAGEAVREQIENAGTGGGGGGAAALIVTVTNGKASHTPAEIYEHLQAGGVVALHTGVLVCGLSHCTEAHAYFLEFYDDFVHYSHYINGAGQYELVTMPHASKAELGNIATALDSIITMQEELIGV